MELTSGSKTKIFSNKAIETISIDKERQGILKLIASFIVSQCKKLNDVHLNFICTHNSRRSQLSQIWAHYAIEKYKLKRIKSYSGGTEVTAFHRNTIKTLQKAGFKFKLINYSHENPIYEITFSKAKNSITGFSKLYNDSINNDPYIVITTCSNAEQNCPFIPEAVERFHVGYTDPKVSDDSESMDKTYLETNKQIAAEMDFLFLQVSMLS